MTNIDPAGGLVDVHAHYLTDRYVQLAEAAGHTLPDGTPAWPTWSLSTHLELMDRHNISRSLLSISTPGVHFGEDQAARALAREVNDFGAAVTRDHPNRFGLFAVLPLPDIDGSLTELTYALDVLGADGVAIETNAHGYYLGDPLFEPLLAELDRRRAIVFVHPTSPPCWEQTTLGKPRPMLEFMFDTTRSVSDLIFSGALDRHPDIDFIIPHGGAALPLLAARIQMFRDVFLAHDGNSSKRTSVGDALATLWYDMAGTPFPLQIPTLTQMVGSEHILYGSDYCFTPPAAVAAQLEAVDGAQPDDLGRTWHAVTTTNAAHLLTQIIGANALRI